MVVYVVILVFTLLAPFVNRIDKKHNYNKFIIMLFIFVVGMRARNVGTDTDNYWYSYLYSMSNRVEPLFFFLRNICRSLSLSVNAYFTLIAILTFVPLWKVIKSNSFNPGFSLLIYYTFSTLFFFQTFNVVRASLAVSYLLLSCSFLQRNNLKQAFFYSIIAILFHYSAILIILFVLLLLDRSNINIGTFLSIICAGPILDGMILIFNNIMPMNDMHIVLKIFLLVISCIAIGIGFSILKSANLGVAPNDMLVLTIVDKTKKSYTIIRLLCDTFFLVVGILLHGVLGIGTIIIWALIAPSIDFFLERTTKFVHNKILNF